jgi:hypothetical protein
MSHKGKDIESLEEYYKKYINIDADKICKVCGGETKFQNLQNGYNMVCTKKCASVLASPNKIECVICDRIFSNKIILEKHIKEVHSYDDIQLIDYFIKYINQNENYRCNKCGKPKKICNFEKGLYCEECFKFKCHLCGDIFKSLKLLQFHVNKHIKNKEIESLKKYYLLYIGKQSYCDICGKILIFSGSFEKPYTTYCSSSCASKGTREKCKETCQKRYGVDNPQQCDEFKKKSVNTSLKRYGTKNPSSSQVIKNKIKNSIFIKYGVENPMHSEDIKEKIKMSSLNRYGVDHPMKNDLIKEKVKNSIFKKYGVFYVSQNEEIKSKIMLSKRRTNRKKHYDRILKICARRQITPLFSKEYYLNHENMIFNFECDICKDKFHLDNVDVAIYPRCIKCFPNERSQFEMEFNSWLSSIYDGEISINNREVIKPKEIDIYIPEINLGLELNGIYYHSDLFMKYDYHIKKTNDALQQGVILLQIFENEFLEKEKILKSMIKNRLGMIRTKIAARKTVFKRVESKEAKKFFEDNHIQGNTPAGIYFGLYHDDELVSAISFSKTKNRNIFGNRDQETKESELLRFCNKLDTNIVGGFSKLFKNSIKDNFFKNVEKIITFANVRYTPSYQKSVYIKSGFKYVKTTTPSYWYQYQGKLYHRYAFRKDVLLKMCKENNIEIFDDDTEFTLADRLGLLRIYDCGNHKFTYNISF